ncbi:hypothetical protein AB0472_40985, partial [Streptomyces sp. NPDC086777]
SDGSVEAWLNTGIAGWSAQGKIAGGVGPIASGDRIAFADVSGDGRDDYLVIRANSSIDAWLTTGSYGLWL